MSTRLASLVLLVASTALSACSDPETSAGGQIGGEAAQCKAVTTTPLPMDQASVLGFSGADVMALAGGDHTATLTWAKGGTTDVTVSVATTAPEARYLDMEYVDDGSGIEPAIGCADVVEVDVTFGFTTADGAFAESWASKIQAPSATEASFYRELDLGGLAGSYAVTEVDPAAFDEVRAFLDATFDATGAHGTVSGQAILNGDASDPDSTASAQMFDIASW